MKVVVRSNEFGSNGKKPLLPLVPEPITVAKKEELAQVEVHTDPTDNTSLKIKYAFKKLNGAETPREIIVWRRHVIHVFKGMILTTGTTQNQMMKQFVTSAALSAYERSLTVSFTKGKARLVMHYQRVLAQGDTDGGNRATQEGDVAAARALTVMDDILAAIKNDVGTWTVQWAIQDMMTFLFPSKILQRVKRYLRCEARKPADMGVKAYYMHISRVNLEEVPLLPPDFDTCQSLGNDELVDLLLFGTPKSWQREMDCQGFDPITKTAAEVVAFMEQIDTKQ